MDLDSQFDKNYITSVVLNIYNASLKDDLDTKLFGADDAMVLGRNISKTLTGERGIETSKL